MKKIKVLVLFYSLGGSTAELARAVSKGAESVADTEVKIKMVPELISEEVFKKNPKMKEGRDKLLKEFSEATVDDLVEADAVAFGTPVRFGSFAAQIKQFLDQLSSAWLQRKLVNKPAAVFCSAGSMHGGEELTLLSLMIPLLNLGMIPVGIPYPLQGESPDFDAGSPYGAIFVTGGGRTLTDPDRKVAGVLGMRLATLAHILSCGCEKCGMCHVMNQELE